MIYDQMEDLEFGSQLRRRPDLATDHVAVLALA